MSAKTGFLYGLVPLTLHNRILMSDTTEHLFNRTGHGGYTAGAWQEGRRGYKNNAVQSQRKHAQPHDLNVDEKSVPSFGETCWSSSLRQRSKKSTHLRRSSAVSAKKGTVLVPDSPT
jgi:hypothetical protein